MSSFEEPYGENAKICKISSYQCAAVVYNQTFSSAFHCIQPLPILTCHNLYIPMHLIIFGSVDFHRMKIHSV